MKTIALLLATALCACGETTKETKNPDVRPDVTQWANEATADQLQEVKGIGEVIAARIVAARPHKDVQSVLDVKGIGEVIAARIIAHVETIQD